MSLALELCFLDGKFLFVNRLVSVMAFQQYCSMLLGLFQALKCVNVSTAVSINKSRVGTRL